MIDMNFPKVKTVKFKILIKIMKKKFKSIPLNISMTIQIFNREMVVISQSSQWMMVSMKDNRKPNGFQLVQNYY